MSYNTKYHRMNISSSKIQQSMLNQATDTSGLTDAFIHRHGPHTTCRTWEERKEGEEPVWTSPDHIMVSTTDAWRISATQIDDTPLTQGMDHSSVSAAIHIESNTTTKNTIHKKLYCTEKDKEEYNELVSSNLPEDGPTEDNEHTFILLHQAMVKAASKIHPQKLHKTKGAERIKLQKDTHKLGKILRHKQRGEDTPKHLLLEKIYTDIKVPTTTSIKTRMYKYNRSEYFKLRNYGAFLNSALNKYSSFKGIEGYHTETDE